MKRCWISHVAAGMMLGMTTLPAAAQVPSIAPWNDDDPGVGPCDTAVRFVNQTDRDFVVTSLRHQKAGETSWVEEPIRNIPVRADRAYTERVLVEDTARDLGIRWMAEGNFDTGNTRTLYSDGYERCIDWQELYITDQ